LESSHVYVKLRGADLAQDDGTDGFTVNVSGTSVDLGTAVSVSGGDEVRVYRVTPSAALVDFANSSILKESDLDTATLQALYQAQEAYDRAFDVLPTGGASGSVLVKTTVTDYDVQWDDSLDAGTAQLISDNTTGTWASSQTVNWNTTPRLNQDSIVTAVTDTPGANGNAFEVNFDGDYSVSFDVNCERTAAGDGNVSAIVYRKPDGGSWDPLTTTYFPRSSASGSGAVCQITGTLTFEDAQDGDRFAVLLSPSDAVGNWEWASAVSCQVIVRKIG
jgi:hypothetical protein